MKKTFPCSITAKLSEAHLVRETAANLGIAILEETSLTNEQGAIMFNFGNLSDEDTISLANAVPREAYYFKAVFTK